jgi:hypothetical protein
MLLDCICFTDNNYTFSFKYHNLHIVLDLQCENVCPADQTPPTAASWMLCYITLGLCTHALVATSSFG